VSIKRPFGRQLTETSTGGVEDPRARFGKVQAERVPDEGSFPGNRQNVFERGLAQAERVVLTPSPAHATTSSNFSHEGKGIFHAVLWVRTGTARKIAAANGVDPREPSAAGRAGGRRLVDSSY